MERNRKPNNRTQNNVQKANQRKMFMALVAVLVIALLGIIILIRKYTPTTERMELTDYFSLIEDNQAAVILNGAYCEVTEDDEAVFAKYEDNEMYLELSFLKGQLDDGYVYDNTENILRYTTDKEVITANLGASEYLVGKSRESFDHNVVISEDNTIYVAIDFIKLYTDITYSTQEAPNRVIIEEAGYEKQTAVLKKDTELRRFGGVKSKILKDGTKGEAVSIIENYGKWSLLLTEDGVLGCVKNNKLTDKKDVTVKATLEAREYNHVQLDEEINLAWHQVTNTSANGGVTDVVTQAKGVNVLSPTWFYINDNSGNIADIGSTDYVAYCHSQNVQVWGLVSNLENREVDTTQVLNTTSSRDNLVNSIVAAAIKYDLDGINVDIEELSGSAADGYVEFIKELSLKCENNGLVLSVDNYAPSASSTIYNRTVQADYADYVVIMAYDEHYSGSEEAGSVASIGFVEKAVKDTLEEVPAEQIILGMPFYSRVWISSDSGLSSQAMGIDDIGKLITNNNASPTWSEELGQYYAEYAKDGKTYMIWQEDATSIEEKLKVMESNKLAGGAFWKIGFDNSSIWNTIAKYIN